MLKFSTKGTISTFFWNAKVVYKLNIYHTVVLKIKIFITCFLIFKNPSIISPM